MTQSEGQTELKIEACPWCGSEALFNQFFAHCKNCGAMGPSEDATPEVGTHISEWNRIARAVRERDVAVKAFREYGWHKPLCKRINGGLDCDCGAFKALKEITNERPSD